MFSSKRKYAVWYKKLTLKNINENAIIKVVAKHFQNGESDNVELITDGSFYMKGNKFYILYKENEEMGMADCSVTIVVDGDTVTMRRRGGYELKLNYREGESESVVYYMPFGEINMTQSTKKVSHSLDENGGCIKITYDLSIGGDVQTNKLDIEIKRKV